MPFMPFHILGIWFRGLLSIAILAGGIYLLSRWYDESHVVEAEHGRRPGGRHRPARGPAPTATGGAGRGRGRPGRRVFRFEPGWNRPTALLAAALALLAWATVGRWIGQGVSMLT